MSRTVHAHFAWNLKLFPQRVPREPVKQRHTLLNKKFQRRGQEPETDEIDPVHGLTTGFATS